MPPGNYRIVAEGQPRKDTYHGGIFAPRELGRVEGTIELRSGDVREMDLSLTVGGRLEVSVTGTPLPEDKAQVIADHQRWPNAEADAYLNWQGELVLLSIERPGRRGENLFHLDSFVKWDKPSLTAHWRMGETHTSEVLPVGRYELVARAPGGRVARIPVEITAGVTAPVEINLDDVSGR